MRKKREPTAKRTSRPERPAPSERAQEPETTIDQTLIAEATEAAKQGLLKQGGIEFEPTAPEELEDLQLTAKQYERSLARGSRSIPITIRMRPEMVAALRAEADRVGARGYQTLLKQWIEERLRGDLQISARTLADAIDPLRGIIHLIEAEVGSAEMTTLSRQEGQFEAIRSTPRARATGSRGPDITVDDEDEDARRDTYEVQRQPVTDAVGVSKLMEALSVSALRQTRRAIEEPGPEISEADIRSVADADIRYIAEVIARDPRLLSLIVHELEVQQVASALKGRRARTSESSEAAEEPPESLRSKAGGA